jgi:hypothetical protein
VEVPGGEALAIGGGSPINVRQQHNQNVAALAALPLVPRYLILGLQCTIAILTIVTKKCLFGGKKGYVGL